jgi:hypothetical protein
MNWIEPRMNTNRHDVEAPGFFGARACDPQHFAPANGVSICSAPVFNATHYGSQSRGPFLVRLHSCLLVVK